MHFGGLVTGEEFLNVFAGLGGAVPLSFNALARSSSLS